MDKHIQTADTTNVRTESEDTIYIYTTFISYILIESAGNFVELSFPLIYFIPCNKYINMSTTSNRYCNNFHVHFRVACYCNIYQSAASIMGTNNCQLKIQVCYAIIQVVLANMCKEHNNRKYYSIFYNVCCFINPD